MDRTIIIMFVIGLLAVGGALAFAIYHAATQEHPCVPKACTPTWAADCYCHHENHRMVAHDQDVLCVCDEP